MIAKTKSITLALLTSFFVVISAAPVTAQQQDPDGELGLPAPQVLGEGIWSTSTTSTTSTMVVGVGLFSWQLATGYEDNEQVRIYLRDNAVAIQHDLYLGGGEAIADLARLFDIRPGAEQHFAHLLYERRDLLSPLVEPGAVDASSAQRFGQIVDDALCPTTTARNALVSVECGN